MSRKIVFINQATGYLTIDVINEFAKEFDVVALITGSIRIQETSLNHKVEISRIIRYDRGNTFMKAFSWIIGTIQIFFLLKFRYRNFERFFYTIPPTGYLLALSIKTTFSILVFDLYPEALKVNGFSEKGVLYRWWSERNRMILPKAHIVYTLSENMKSQVLAYSSDIDVHVIPNWTAFSGLIPIEKEENRIIKSEGLDGKFIVQYSGNIGVTHNVETLIKVAEMLREDTGIEFLIIGRGKRSHAIGDLIIRLGLTNCRLLPFRKDEELFESLCAADLAVIILDDKIPDISVPSKTYNILAAGVPVMAIASSDSEISKIISSHQIGKSFEKENVKGMCEFVKELKNNEPLWKRMHANSFKASENYTNANAAKYLELYHN